MGVEPTCLPGTKWKAPYPLGQSGIRLAVESSIAVEDAVENHSLHSTTIARLRPVSGLEQGGKTPTSVCGCEIGRDSTSQSHSPSQGGAGPRAVAGVK